MMAEGEINGGTELGYHDWNHFDCPLTQPQSLASGYRTNRFITQVYDLHGDVGAGTTSRRSAALRALYSLKSMT
jgi:hypothetical protein